MEKIQKESKSPEAWREIWLNKSHRLLKDHIVLPDMREKFSQYIKEYLIEYPGIPYSIPIDNTNEYIKAKHLKPLPALGFFYEHIAPSEQHIDSINSIKEDVQKEHCLLLNSLKKELKLHNYSQQTIKNYLNITKQYFAWLGRPPLKDDRNYIKSYILSDILSRHIYWNMELIYGLFKNS